MRKTLNFSGKLIYNQDAEYVLQFRNGFINISTILDRICDSNKKYVEIKIMNCCKLIYEEKGNLMKYKSYDTSVVDYHVNGNCLGDVLFDSCDELLDIEIVAETLVDGIGEVVDYGEKQSISCAK